MKTNILVSGILLGAVAFVGAATNDLTTALQRGLFEEEANQNLGAAISAYQTVASQFDKDRKLAATAIFRLGECYRKQGNTNDAATQYERILREFSDQPTLVTLSRQSLAAMGSAPPAPAATTAGQTAAPATASEAEEVKRIQAMIKDSPDLINATDASGFQRTPLHPAAWAGQLVVAQFLLENGAEVDAKDRQGETPLHNAAQAGHKAMVELLLSHKANVQAPGDKGQTPLHLAAGNGFRSVVEILLAHGADVNAKMRSGSTPLLLAVVNGFRSVAELLLAHGADVNARTSEVLSFRGTESFSGTALDVAAARGDQPLVELLLAKGADANAESGDGRTPLSYAAEKHDQAVLELLLAAHANPNAGRVALPLTLAAYEGDMAALKLLLASGADPNTNSTLHRSLKAKNGWDWGNGDFTPLFLAINQRHADAVKVLLEGGADPNARTGGMPLLMQAVWDNNQPAVELLLAHQADVNEMNNSEVSERLTPLHYAASSRDKAIAELLLKAGATVNARDTNGATPLHFAVRNGNRELAELLLDNKADPNQRNNAGQTPLDLAKSQAQSAQGQPPPWGPGNPMPVGVPVARPQRQAPGTPSTAPGQASKSEDMADLLRRHGALDDLPKLDRIIVHRRSAGLADTAFTKGPHDWGQFTLLDLIGVQYSFLEASPNAGGGAQSYWPVSFAYQYPRWSFPDLAHLRIRRPAPDQKSWQERIVDLRPVLDAGDCAKDVRLEWGDVVEIPEADHPLNEQWPGFSRTELANLKKCLTRRVEIVINGQATNLTLAPRISHVGEETQAAAAPPLTMGTALEQGSPITIVPGAPFWLRAVLLQSKLVLTSSDLRHVKVTRHDPASGQEREWVVDCSNASPAPNFWVRDGDKIEVPERTDSASAEEAMPAPPASPGQPAPPHFTQRLQSIIQRPPPSYAESAVPPPAPAGQMQPEIVQLPTRIPRLAAAGPVGKPPLFQALPDAPTFKALLEDGADPNVRTAEGTPLLVQAVRDKNQVAVELLLSHQADVNAANSDGWTPLDYATADGLKAIVELLLKAGASVNARNPSGETPLHIAIRGGQRELAELLLAHKADPNVRNNAGQTPLALAQSMGRSLGMGGAVPLAPGSETPQGVEAQYLSIGGVLHSPKPDDSKLLKAGYHTDRSARARKAESWEQRAGADLKGRGGNVIWTGTEMIEFGGEGMGTSFDDGARYCFAEDTWAALPQEGAPGSRTGHTAIWTGKEMIVWGGFNGVWGNDTLHNDGARYNPASDTWKPVATKNAPSARVDFSAVWAGREMLVWGGFTDTHSRYQGGHADAHLNTGGRYDPSSDSWKTITTQGAPSKRWLNSMVWTGKEAIIWGGGNATKALGDGGRYNPARDSWKPVSADGAPSPRLGHVAVWTGKEMIVWGGTTRETDTQAAYFENGARYNPKTDTWRPISTIGAPKGRVQTVAVWTGAEMVIWGGVNDAQAGGVLDSGRYVGTGARYNPATDTWTEITLTGAPSPRYTIGLWTGEGLLTFGGYNGTHLNDVWFYSPSRTLYAYVKQ